MKQISVLLAIALPWLTLAILAPVTTANPQKPIAPSTTGIPLQFTPPPLSQAPTAAPILQQGNQILLNGRAIAAAWMQWKATTPSTSGTRTGISDAGLLQIAGMELLNTNDPSRQPLQWFSDPVTNPLNLATRLTSLFRFLDITDLAQRAGWQMQVSGNVLRVTSPGARVLAVRQGKQPWGDRLVIELDRAAPGRVDQQNQELILTLDAQVDPALVAQFKSNPADPNQIFSLDPVPNQTQMRLKLSPSLSSRIWSLTAPNRLIIDRRADVSVDRDVLWAPGLRWRRQTLTLGASRFPVVWLTVNPRQPGISLKPILPSPNGMAGTAPLLQTARQNQVVAAINGGFFNRNNQLPLGAVRRDGNWLSGPILNRGAIAWNANGETKIDRLTLQETLVTPSGQRLPLTHLNSGYIQAGIARYTSDWGTTYSPLTDNEILVTVQANRVASQETITAAGSRSVTIPATGYLLVLRSNRTVAASLPPGTVLRLETTVNPPDFARYPQIVAAGPFLVQNRQLSLDAKAEGFSDAFVIERASRSAIGRLSDGTLILVAVHQRVGGSGASLTEIAQLMQQLGAIDALNLDGGSSTTLYLGGQLLDRLPRNAARVHNAIGIFLQPNP